jgi:hypothetical protein
MSDEEKLVSHYRLKTLLRKDGFGAVYLGEDTRDQKEYVLRIIELDQATLARITGRVRARSQRDHPLIEQIRQRMKRISEVKHAHILPVIEFGEEHISGNNDIIFYMVSPYEKESLLTYWSAYYSSTELITLEVIADLIFQAAEALFYVHKRGLIHQYVRLSSFMLRSSTRNRKHLHLLLTDFWFADISAALLEEGQVAQDLSVYLAPEQLAGRVLAASDQYTLAILAYELLLGYRLSQVDLSLGLYERALRQRATEVSEVDLEIARRLDLVLARALAEDASARFNNIEEFAYMFRAIVRGEAVDLSDEATFKLPIVKRRGARGGEIAVAAAGALIAGEVAEYSGEIQAAEGIGEEARAARHPGLHKTVLTSEGMEVVEAMAAGAVVEETTLSASATAGSDGTQSGLVVAEEEIVTLSEGEQTRSSAAVTGAAGFAAGLVTGEALQQEIDLSAEETQIRESSATAFVTGLAIGEALQKEADLSAEEIRIREIRAVAFAAGLSAGEALQQEADLSAEKTHIRESNAAAFAAGMIAGEAVQQEMDLSAEQTQLRESSAAAFAGGLVAGEAVAYEQEATLSEEQTQTFSSGGGLLAAGAAGLLAGAMLAGEATQVAGTGAAPGLAGAGTSSGLAGSGAASGAGATGGLTGAGAGATGSGSGAMGELVGAGAAGSASGAAGSASGNVGELVGAGAAGALAGVGVAIGAGVGVLESTQVAGAGTGMAAGGFVAGGGAIASRRRNRRRNLLIALLAALFLVIIVGSGVIVFAGSFSSATVTLTLQSHTIQNSYLVTAVTGTTTTGQIQANTLTSTTSQSQSGHVSGYYPGSEANGFVTLHNTSGGCGCPVFVPAGTAFVGNSGVTVVIDYGVSVASQCQVTVPAHAMVYGPGGDIGAGDIHAAYSSTIWANNPYAFTGGQGGQSNALVQKSDINKLAAALQTQTTQSAQAGLQSQAKSGQHLLPPLCQSKISSDHPVGDNATGVTVTVATTCTTEAYDYSGAVQIVQQKIETQASTFFSSEFVLVGPLQTSVSSATVIDAKAGTVLLAINAVGKWAYRFSHGLKQSLAKVIAGKDVNAVRAYLTSEGGISAVNITVSGVNQNSLPSDDSKITIVLKS